MSLLCFLLLRPSPLPCFSLSGYLLRTYSCASNAIIVLLFCSVECILSNFTAKYCFVLILSVLLNSFVSGMFGISFA